MSQYIPRTAHTVAVEQIMDYFGAITPDAGS